jgi:hypothetical protein
LFTHVGLQVCYERRAEGLANGAALVGGLAVDAALDLEQGVERRAKGTPLAG